jgi:hypothetical protein
MERFLTSSRESGCLGPAGGPHAKGSIVETRPETLVGPKEPETLEWA